MMNTSLIQVNNLTKKYHHHTIFKNVNLKLESSNIYIVDGQNGVGKSTFLKCLCGLIKYTGEIKINKSISYVPEKVILPAYIKTIDFLTIMLKVKTNVTFSKIKIIDYLNKFKIEQYKDKYIYTLSLGTKQKLLIIMALIEDKDIYLFDEPLNGLDYKSIQIFKEEIVRLRKQGKLIIIVSHDKSIFNNLKINRLIINEEKIDNESN